MYFVVYTEASDNPMAIAVLANLYVNQTRSEMEKRTEYKKKLFELAEIKGYDIEKTKRLFTFVFYLMQLPKEMDAEMKSYFFKTKKNAHMGTITQAKQKKSQLADDERFINFMSYHAAYGKSYEEIYDIVNQEAAEKISFIAAEQAKVIAAEQAKVMAAEQAKTITTMFQKTGWSADKIADISGFPIDLVEKTLAGIKA